MALSRGKGARFSANTWPGFVDAMTALLMVLMFVLTIFMIVQFALRETISSQDDELAALSSQVSDLADALGLERRHAAELAGEISGLSGSLDAAKAAAERQSQLVATLNATLSQRGAELTAAETRISDFETQVAGLLTERDAARQDAGAQEEAARILAARRAALEALVADLRAEGAASAGKLTEAETARLTEAAAAAALREKLKGSEDALTAMTLALDAQRRRAEETLTMLAAAEAARKDLDTRLAAALVAQNVTAEELATAQAAATDREAVSAQLAAALAAKLAAETARGTAEDETAAQRALLATANTRLAEEEAATADGARRVALLNEQLTALRGQLGALQGMLDASAARDAGSKVQIETLGGQLNSALARVAAEEKRRAELEAAEKARLEAEAASLKEQTTELARYRSEFFGKLSSVLAGRPGVRVVGDRFVFSSEVLFEPGSAVLAPAGKQQIFEVVQTLQEVAAAIPPDIDWIIRVDGHTDDVPLSGQGAFRDNWELSLARALSVVRYMQGDLGFPPEHLAATGFGEYRPVAEGDSPEARALNRRIELKLTER